MRWLHMSNTFCNFPWKQIYVATSGHQRLCCQNIENIEKEDGYKQYNMLHDKITDCWNSEYMKKMRLAMIKGEKVATCSKCYTQEQEGYNSLRNTEGKDYFVKNTNSDGSLNYLPTDLELHFGNLCNLSCKMCSQQFSHTIGKELLKMGDADSEFLTWVKKESGVVNNWTGELDVVYDWFKNEKIKNSIFAFVSDHVEELNIIGGEPTVIKEFFELLEFCHKAGTLQNKSIMIHSNMTNINPKLTDWLGSMKRWSVAASIDGIDERNRYIRYPSNWNSILKNLDFYKNITNKFKNGYVSFGPAIQLLNVDHIVDLFEFFQSQTVTQFGNFFSHVKHPIICDYDILPTDYKQKVADHLIKNLGRIKIKNFKHEIETHINGLQRELYSEEQKLNYQTMFIKYNDSQDRFRNNTMTWRKLLPNLEKSLLNLGHK